MSPDYMYVCTEVIYGGTVPTLYNIRLLTTSLSYDHQNFTTILSECYSCSLQAILRYLYCIIFIQLINSFVCGFFLDSFIIIFLTYFTINITVTLFALNSDVLMQ